MGPLRVLLRGRTAVVVTHDPALIEWADRVVAIEELRRAPAGAAA
jgi:ABC-type lipoprotein export system ATPase subunit